MFMAQELIPNEGQPPLAIDEIIRRLKASFKHVKLDTESAKKECEVSIQRITSGLARGAKWCSTADLARAERELGKTVNVIVADDTTTYISFTLSPETEQIFIGFEGGDHEEAAMPLCERLEEVLGYDMETV
jgi:hypothetical protein